MYQKTKPYAAASVKNLQVQCLDACNISFASLNGLDQLVNGVAVVNNANVLPTSTILLTHATVSGSAIGVLTVVPSNGSFTVISTTAGGTSTQTGDDSFFHYLIVN